HRSAAAHHSRYADRGNDRGRLIRGACERLVDQLTGFSPGGEALGKRTERFIAAWLATFSLLVAGSTHLCADEFKTPSISAARIEWRGGVGPCRHRKRGPAPTRTTV